MDRLFTRYADPFSLLDGYIRTTRFCEFIHTFAKETAETDRWEFFLHKVWNQNYTEFCEALEQAKEAQKTQQMSENEIIATVQKSKNILGNLNPEREEGEK